MTADFMKNGGMKTYSLYDNPLTTCMGNDYGYEYIFSRPLEFLGNEMCIRDRRLGVMLGLRQ